MEDYENVSTNLDKHIEDLKKITASLSPRRVKQKRRKSNYGNRSKRSSPSVTNNSPQENRFYQAPKTDAYLKTVERMIEKNENPFNTNKVMQRTKNSFTDLSSEQVRSAEKFPEAVNSPSQFDPYS
jgi:hypothetical protein